MENINGEVLAVSQKDGRYGVRIGEIWYDGFGTCPIAKGDVVDIEYVKKDKFNDISTINKGGQTSLTKGTILPDLNGIGLMTGCYNAITEIIGHAPKEQEVAMVNSLFIYNTRR